MEAREQLGSDISWQGLEPAFMNAPIGMALIALDGSFGRVNPAMSELTGYPAEELARLTVEDIAHPDDYEEQVALFRKLRDREIDSYTVEKRFTKKSGEVIWLMIAVSLVRDDSGEPLYLIGQTANISASKQVEADLRHEAGRDPLTELANRRQLERAIEKRIERARRFGEVASVLMLDLDGFKPINDRHGHETGDEVLRFFASELRGQVRANDVPARLGGDEFVVLMTGVGPDHATVIAGQLMDHFEKVTFEPDGLALPCGISVGSATIEASTGSAADVLAVADRSMYEVKRVRRSA